MIPYGKQQITQQDIDAVVEVLQSDFLTQGDKVPAFEQAVSQQVDSLFAVAVNSATSALHIACLALGLDQGDWLWTSPNTFVASANCGLYCGAQVDFVDIDPSTYNLCPDQLEIKLIQAKKENRLPKVVIPVHFAGQSCDMKRIHQLSQRYGFRLIEDASHAIGAHYLGQPVGNCAYSDITIFSFHPVKIITTAEGGMATTNNPALADTMRLLRSHGVTRQTDSIKQKHEGAWYYEQIALGLNYRLTDIQAALGISQMQRLTTFIQRRQALAKTYQAALAHLPITLPYQHPNSHSAFHLYPILLNLEAITLTRSSAFAWLRQQGIGVNVHYIPVHTQPYYQQMGFKLGDFPHAEHYYQQTISIPLFHDMTNEQQRTVIHQLHNMLT